MITGHRIRFVVYIPQPRANRVFRLRSNTVNTAVTVYSFTGPLSYSTAPHEHRQPKCITVVIYLTILLRYWSTNVLIW